MSFGSLERTTNTKPMSEINMTPLIDVMLVLLVIFMVTAPLMTSGLRLKLPQSDAAALGEDKKILAISITPKGELYLDDEKLSADALSTRVDAAAKQAPDIEVHLRADKLTPYGAVAELVGMVQKIGLTRIAFVTEAPRVGREPVLSEPR